MSTTLTCAAPRSASCAPVGLMATRSPSPRTLTFPAVPSTSPSAARRRLASATCSRSASSDIERDPILARVIRRCRDDERDAILAIVSEAAEAYRGVIPADRWREPYMPAAELDGEIAAGVAFWGYEDGGGLAGIMGIQPLRNVDLIRHAYVAPARQGRGIGSALLEHLMRTATRRTLVGTWAAAGWAIRFYERHGFTRADPDLLRTYWSIPERQIETSVVLERPAVEPRRTLRT